MTPLLQPKPPATVRNNCAMAVPLGGTAKAATFGGFKRCITSFRMVRAALHDIPTCFITCQKLFCVTDVILFAVFDAFCFLGKRSTLDTSIVILRGRRSTSDVSCSVFFANAVSLQHVSSRFCGVAVPVWGATKHLVFEGFKTGP